METTNYLGGDNLLAGPVSTDQVALAADAYYTGMPLAYKATPTATGPGTGNGTCTALSADASVKTGDWVLDFSAALVADLEDPDGNVVRTLSFVDGGATVCEVGGLKFTITDGATAFGASSEFTITVPEGAYEYTEDLTKVNGIYFGPEKTLATAGYGTVITNGEISDQGIVDDSGDALALTAADRAALASKGLRVKRTS